MGANQVKQVKLRTRRVSSRELPSLLRRASYEIPIISSEALTDAISNHSPIPIAFQNYEIETPIQTVAHSYNRRVSLFTLYPDFRSNDNITSLGK